MLFADIVAAVRTALVGGQIKSIQRGTVAISNGSASGTATITSVDTTKAVVLLGGFSINDNASTYSTITDKIGRTFPRLSLTNSTTVTFQVHSTVTAANVLTCDYQVVEFY